MLGIIIYFWYGSLDICCIFLWCEQPVSPRVLSVFLGGRRLWVGLVASVWCCWALNSSKDLQEGVTGYSKLQDPEKW